VNDWTFQELIAAFDMNESELIDILLRLDKLGIIDYRPPYRIRKLTARNFSWRTDGPVHEFFVTRFAPEFFRSTFDGPGEAFRFAGGLLSPESLARFKACARRKVSSLRVPAILVKRMIMPRLSKARSY
jgi:hypothetical protein